MRTPILISCAAVSLAMLGCDVAPEQKAKPVVQAPGPAVVVQNPAPDGGKPALGKKSVGKKCKKDDCNLKVDVTDSCAITVDHDLVGVTKGIEDVPITWTIQQNHFEFTAKGIEFRGNPPSFPPGSPSPDGKSFTVIDKNNQPGDDLEFKYSVTVKRKNGTACPTLDPTIINGY